MRRSRAKNRTNQWLRIAGAQPLGGLSVLALVWGLVAAVEPGF